MFVACRIRNRAALAAGPKVSFPAAPVAEPSAVDTAVAKLDPDMLSPKEALAASKLEKGDAMHLTESPDVFRITTFDPEFGQQMSAAEAIIIRATQKNRMSAAVTSTEVG